MTEVIVNAALTEGGKAIANFGIKFATVVLSSAASIFILKNIHDLEDPITPEQLSTQEGMKAAIGRSTRDACITAGTAITGSVIYRVAADAVLNS